jgi:hypothetical protein
MKKNSLAKKERIDKTLNQTGREKYFTVFASLLLLAVGLYHSIHLFGHRPVPNTDFFAFNRIGHQLWSLQLPSDYKRGPVVGLLQVPLSLLIAGANPDLTASWLLNAILHPFNLLLLWLIGRRFIGRWAFWVAIVAMTNPWVLWLVTESLAETTYLFFILLSFYLIFRQSHLRYLFASITTMVRYEGAALILVSLVIDIIQTDSKTKRVRAFIYSAMALAPLMLWLTGSFLTSGPAGGYIGFIDPGKLKYFPTVLRQLWQVTFNPLITLTLTGQGPLAALSLAAKIIAALLFVYGCICGLFKKRTDILALLIFLVPYMIIHMLYVFSVGRFYAVVHWIILLICCYGLQSLWALINKNNRIPRRAVLLAQVGLAIIILLWITLLVPQVSHLHKLSPVCAPLPYVTILTAALALAGYAAIYKAKLLRPFALAGLLVCAAAFSSQPLLTEAMGRGLRDIEFKLLAQWYLENALPGARLATTGPHIVALFAPEYKSNFVHIGSIKADNPDEFIKSCLDNNITYIAWESRIGFAEGNYYYNIWGMANIANLAKPATTSRYRFLAQIRGGGQFINVFAVLRKPLPAPS